MGESNKMVKLQDVVQAKQVPFKKKIQRKPKDSTSAQVKPVER